MRIILAAIILSVFLPVSIFAVESLPTLSVSPSCNVFDSLRGASAKIESYIIPESAKEKGVWAWTQDALSELFGRAIRTASSIGGFVKNKGQAVYSFFTDKAKEKIGENIWVSGEAYIKNFINYIDKKIKN